MRGRAGPYPRVWLFVDDAYEISHVVRVARLASRGASVAVVIRAREVSRRHALLDAFAAASLGPSAALVTTGDVAEVGARGLSGVHLGGIGREAPALRRERIVTAREQLPEGAWLSAPTHEDDDVLLARDCGADVLVVSPVFASPAKGPARGAEAITRARALAPSRFVVGLGGVGGPGDATSCRLAGADAVGVVRALFDAPDPETVSGELSSVWG